MMFARFEKSDWIRTELDLIRFNYVQFNRKKMELESPLEIWATKKLMEYVNRLSIPFFFKTSPKNVR